MKMILTLVVVWGALLVGGCGDQSLVTDEEYKEMKGPAPYGNDPARHIPQSAAQRSVLGSRY